MRYAFGLVGLLVVSAILITLFANNSATVIKESKPAFEAAQQLSGQDENGVKASDSVKYEPVFTPNGKFTSLTVSWIDPAGPMAKHYKLQINDEIIEAATFQFKDDDAEMAKEWVLKAYTMSRPLIIRRNGEKMSLPFVR